LLVLFHLLRRIRTGTIALLDIILYLTSVKLDISFVISVASNQKALFAGENTGGARAPLHKVKGVITERP
jgi:hypothetical protein